MLHLIVKIRTALYFKGHVETLSSIKASETYDYQDRKLQGVYFQVIVFDDFSFFNFK